MLHAGQYPVTHTATRQLTDANTTGCGFSIRQERTIRTRRTQGRFENDVCMDVDHVGNTTG